MSDMTLQDKFQTGKIIPSGTRDEMEAFQELKRLTRTENPDFNDNVEFHSDLILFHCIKKYNDPVLALNGWKESVEWRKEFGVDTILNSYVPKIPLEMPYPRQIHKTDKLGRPIGITRISLINFELFKMDPDGFLSDLVHEHEKTRTIRLRACSIKRGKLVNQFLNILDLKGATFSTLNHGYQLTATVNNIVQKHFPDAMGKMFIINAPWVFYQVWSLAKKFLLEERVVNKIEVLGSDYIDALLKVVDEDNLPDYLGGSCNCDGGCENKFDIGPWNDDESQQAQNFSVNAKDDYNFH